MTKFTPGWRAGAVLALALAAASGGCGKKGPPLAPFLRIPAAPGEFAGNRFGSTVYLKFLVPTKNQDASMPADVARVEVYGFTGKPESDEEFVKYGTLVASVQVRRPPPPDEEEDRPRGKDAAGQPPKPERKKAEEEPGFDQGSTVTVTETLTQPLMQPVAVKRRVKRAVRVQPPILLPVASPSDLPARVYVAVAVNHKGRRGSFSPHVAVPLVDPPPPPERVEITYTETAITVRWTPPPGAPFPAVAPVPEPDVVDLPRRLLVSMGAPVWAYDIFAPAAEPSTDKAASSGRSDLPRPDASRAISPQPLTTTTNPWVIDSRPLEFGVERCYVLRTKIAFGPLYEEGEASPVACVTPRDTFPPAAPKGLVAVGSAGAISLNWEPNTEKDLAGYVVLRGEAPGTSLQPLTAAPIAETSYEDKDVKAGVRYVYAVVAVDKAANTSEQSNRIEETAR